MCLGWGLPRHWILEPLPGGSIERNYYGIRSPKLEQGWSFGTQFHNGSIYDPGSRFADPPPHPLPKPSLCDCAHFLRAPKPSSVMRIAPQRRPIRVTVLILLARFTREAAKAVDCHEDRKEKLLRHEGAKQGNCHEDRVP